MTSHFRDSTDTVAYSVTTGDTLTTIVNRYYGQVTPVRRQEIIRSIRAANPAIKNPNHIVPGQLIRLEVPVQSCPIPQRPVYSLEDWYPVLQRDWSTATPDERNLQIGLAKLMLGTGSAQLAAIDRTFKGNAPLLAEMVENYEEFKRGEISKGRYDYRRAKLVKQVTQRLGPTHFLLNGSKSPNEMLRISRKRGAAPTQPITRQIAKMQRVSKLAARGGVALSIVGLGIACHEIAQTNDAGKKNEILVESVGGIMGGVAFGAGAGLAIFLMATPVGWVGALAIGAGGAAFGYFSGRTARNLYNANGQPIDFVNALGVSTLCKPSGTEWSARGTPKLSNAAMSVL
ncbi:LysM peptidoglycan-binding domain-containing protein [Gilvimarinus sp. F26214L]|uniref:LysM peptidoglycan-binding domain-containing protein n=1 Tax=Gilvimarinus sp. DZF01 TaxID=3461371 RepID=UPI004046299D